MPFKNFHSFRQFDPIDGHKTRTKVLGDKGIELIYDVDKKKVQSVRFDKKKWTFDQSKDWCEKNKFKVGKGVPAKKKEAIISLKAVLIEAKSFLEEVAPAIKGSTAVILAGKPGQKKPLEYEAELLNNPKKIDGEWYSQIRVKGINYDVVYDPEKEVWFRSDSAKNNWR